MAKPIKQLKIERTEEGKYVKTATSVENELDIYDIVNELNGCLLRRARILEDLKECNDALNTLELHSRDILQVTIPELADELNISEAELDALGELRRKMFKFIHGTSTAPTPDSTVSAEAVVDESPNVSEHPPAIGPSNIL